MILKIQIVVRIVAALLLVSGDDIHLRHFLRYHAQGKGQENIVILN
jgi:hypothetical protein